MSLENIPLEEKLDRVLELLFNVPWLALERKGSVFIVDDKAESLTLISKKYLDPWLKTCCASVAFGHCLCGKAAASKKLVYHNHVNQEHAVRFESMPDHGHYCQPIVSAKGLVGVLNLYLAAGHIAKPVEAPFLSDVADTLAGLIELEQSKTVQRRLNTILDATPDFVTITDTAGNFLYCNDGAKSMFSEVHDFVPHSIQRDYPEQVAKLLLELAYPNAIEAGIWEGDIMLNLPDGSELPVSQLVMAHRDVPGGEVVYFSTVAHDISDRRRAEIAAQTAALREKSFANTLINSLPGIFFIMGEAGHLIRWNRNLEVAIGYTGRQLSNMELLQLVEGEDVLKIATFAGEARGFGKATVELNLLKREGGTIPFFFNGVRLDGFETDSSIACTGIDISYRYQLEQELLLQATTDVMTGAFNRRKMEVEIELEIRKYVRNPLPFSLAMLDIDHFKRVNDTFGHDAGDQVLKQVVELVRQQLRETDMLGRWGGEEFIILSSSSSIASMQALTERVRVAIAAHSITPAGHITVSMGVSEYQAGESQKTLLKRIDDALYLAKESGRNQVKIG